MQRAKKSYGQNWLVDPTAVQKLVDAAEIKKGDRVLEIGPGTGIITQALLEAGAKVTSVELDSDLVEPLREKFGDRIELIEGDALALRPEQFPKSPYKLVSSIPYQITSDILKTFLTTSNPPVSMCLVVQKEVAERIVAKPPKMSLLSVACQVYATCEYVATIKAGAFRPIPKVDSAVVRLVLNDSKKKYGGLDPEEVIRVAKVGFSSKRKQLKNNLGAWKEAECFMEEAGLAANVRAENLTVDEWVKLVGKMRAV